MDKKYQCPILTSFYIVIKWSWLGLLKNIFPYYSTCSSNTYPIKFTFLIFWTLTITLYCCPFYNKSISPLFLLINSIQKYISYLTERFRQSNHGVVRKIKFSITPELKLCYDMSKMCFIFGELLIISEGSLNSLACLSRLYWFYIYML